MLPLRPLPSFKTFTDEASVPLFVDLQAAIRWLLDSPLGVGVLMLRWCAGGGGAGRREEGYSTEELVIGTRVPLRILLSSSIRVGCGIQARSFRIHVFSDTSVFLDVNYSAGNVEHRRIRLSSFGDIERDGRSFSGYVRVVVLVTIDH